VARQQRVSSILLHPILAPSLYISVYSAGPAAAVRDAAAALWLRVSRAMFGFALRSCGGRRRLFHMMDAAPPLPPRRHAYYLKLGAL